MKVEVVVSNRYPDLLENGIDAAVRNREVEDDSAITARRLAETRRMLARLAPHPLDWAGIRDRAMLHLCFAAGSRVPELVGLGLEDVELQPQPSIVVHGKGRKERCLPLWKQTTTALRSWLAVRGHALTPEVFVDARHEPMSRAGFEYILVEYVHIASQDWPSLAGKRVAPHVLRPHPCRH